MANKKVVEIVIYIHGVSPSLQEKPHTKEYTQLHKGIKAQDKAKANGWPASFCGVEWGGNLKPVEKNPKSHKLLTAAQRNLGGRIMPVVDEKWDFTINPARLVVNNLRKLAFYGFGDMFYYVSTDGKQAVRCAVAKQIIAHTNKVKNDDLLSLTILGHSAGSVVGFDFLFYLFSKKRSAKDFVSIDKSVCTGMKKLENRITKGTLRLRRFITFGSPIAFTACRSDAVLKILAGSDQLGPTDYGLTAQFTNNLFKLSGPRWINFWDKDDPLAWPVEPLMKDLDPATTLDVYTDVSDSVTEAHNAYWGDKNVHGKIAQHW